jgi:hypothetical protein
MSEDNYISGISLYSKGVGTYNIQLCQGGLIASGTPISAVNSSCGTYDFVATTTCNVADGAYTDCSFDFSYQAEAGMFFYFVITETGSSPVVYNEEDKDWEFGELLFAEAGGTKLTGFGNPAYWNCTPSMKLKVYYDDTIQIDYSLLDWSDDTNSKISFYFPNDGYEVSNDEWTDWAVLYDMTNYDYSNYETWVLRITYFDSQSNYFLDAEEIATTSELTMWTMERSEDLAEGAVGSIAEVWGTNDCADVSSIDCEWTVLTESASITWYASTTGYNLYDNPYLIQPGYTIPTSTLYDLFGASTTDEMGIFSAILSPIISALKLVFPFNLGANVYEQWLLSNTQTLPISFAFLDVVDDNNDISMTYPAELIGTATTVPIFGSTVLTQTTNLAGFFSDVRGLSSYLLYTLLLLGIGYRGILLYKNYKSN